MKKLKFLTKDHIEAMRLVEEGADVYSYLLAKLLREVERFNPNLIHIGKPMMFKGSGVEQMPYFGAILKKEGKTYLGVNQCRI